MKQAKGIFSGTVFSAESKQPFMDRADARPEISCRQYYPAELLPMAASRGSYKFLMYKSRLLWYNADTEMHCADY